MSDLTTGIPTPPPSPEDTADNDLLLEKIVQEHLTRAPVTEVTAPFRAGPAETPNADGDLEGSTPNLSHDNNLETAIAALLGTIDTPPAPDAGETPILPVVEDPAPVTTAQTQPDAGLSGAEIDSLLAPATDEPPLTTAPLEAVSPPKVSAPFAATEEPDGELIKEAFVAGSNDSGGVTIKGTDAEAGDAAGQVKTPAATLEPAATDGAAAAIRSVPAIAEPAAVAPTATAAMPAVANAVEASSEKAPATLPSKESAVASAAAASTGSPEAKEPQAVTPEETAGLLPSESPATPAVPAVGVKKKPRFLHDLFLLVAQVLDMPFASMSQDSKQSIGLAGAIFLVTGMVLVVIANMHR